MVQRVFHVATLLATATLQSAWADVDLVTLPRRESTQLTIYNSEDITMVREQRLLTVNKGVNRIQFTWANTLIDPTSIDFRILDHHDQVDLIDTTFPTGRNDSLQWNIRSDWSGQIPVEIRYFTSGITWDATYIGIANQAETTLRLTGYVRVDNHSGELYDNAQTRLVVGTINLVEKIADLARRPAPTTARDAEEEDYADKAKDDGEIRRELVRSRFGRALGLAGGGGFGDRPPTIVKQGLSEYFLFTIAGRETIKDREPKRLVCLKVADIPLECLYKLTDRDNGQQFHKFYRFKNVKLSDKTGRPKNLTSMENLGTSPLPNGNVRLFSEYANRDLAYVGGTEIKYVPIGDRVEVDVEIDNDITINRRLKDQHISNIVSRQYERRLNNEFVVLFDRIDFDETFVYEEEIVSGKPVDVKAEIERKLEGPVVLWSQTNPPADWTSNAAGAYADLHAIPGRVELVDQNHVKYFLDLPPGKKTTVTYQVTYKRRKVGPELNARKVRRPL